MSERREKGRRQPKGKQRNSGGGGGPLTLDTVAVSKALSWLLRHGAAEAGLSISPDGFILLSEVLAYPKLKGVSVQQIERIVADSDKQRFALLTDEDGARFIRANQGHTLQGLDDAALLTELSDPSEAPICIHGTYRSVADTILTSGLSRMTRNHVHCAGERTSNL